tara:strand:+ start:3282 stop:4136 length:855 start_codon:yes stop_codon:yes gene_type:complete
MYSKGLFLIGMGPGGVSNMTEGAINAAKSADHRRYEAYTALWSEEDLSELENIVGPIEKVMRPEVEKPDKLLEMASTSSVALLVVGDPLQATTHVDLQLQAAEAGVSCSVIHGISITSIVSGAIGLSNYKFGRQTTLTYSYEGGWVATSPLEVIGLNHAQGLHTLAFLDLDPTGAGTGDQRPMQPKDAVESLLSMAEKLLLYSEEMPTDTVFDRMKVESVIKICNEISSLMVVLCSDMGTKKQAIRYLSVSELNSAAEGGLHCLVIPAELSEVELAALQRWTKE